MIEADDGKWVDAETAFRKIQAAEDGRERLQRMLVTACDKEARGLAIPSALIAEVARLKAQAAAVKKTIKKP